jgi:SPP1 gp7 family putative phage head morphogenesis protein
LKARAKIAKIMHAFLQAEAPKLAAQVGAMRSRMGKVSQDDLDLVDRILRDLDLSDWAVLVGEIEETLAEIVHESGAKALVQVGIDVEARREVLNIVSADALAYARVRSAEMVGMRYDELGRLVENPNAAWRITDSTREYMRADVTRAMEEGWSNDKLAGQLRESYGFSSDRATMIARTETQKAGNAGALAGYKASGIVDGTQWLTSNDDKVTPECEENGRAGPNGDGVLPLGSTYPSGDEAPPSHPQCRCTLAPWIDWNKQPAAVGSDNQEE